jgi:hypothetical protein
MYFYVAACIYNEAACGKVPKPYASAPSPTSDCLSDQELGVKTVSHINPFFTKSSHFAPLRYTGAVVHDQGGRSMGSMFHQSASKLAIFAVFVFAGAIVIGAF